MIKMKMNEYFFIVSGILFLKGKIKEFFMSFFISIQINYACKMKKITDIANFMKHVIKN